MIKFPRYLVIILPAMLLFVFGCAQNRNKIDPHQLTIDRQQFWDNLPKPDGYVNDYEHLFYLSEKLQLDSIISAFKKETGMEIAIVTIDSASTARDYFDALTLHIADEWGVGEKGKDNGILIGLCSGHRKIRINNGKGTEKLISDAETLEIVNKYFIPYLKKGEYYNGTLTGLTELIKLLRTKIK